MRTITGTIQIDAIVDIEVSDAEWDELLGASDDDKAWNALEQAYIMGDYMIDMHDIMLDEVEYREDW